MKYLLVATALLIGACMVDVEVEGVANICYNCSYWVYTETGEPTTKGGNDHKDCENVDPTNTFSMACNGVCYKTTIDQRSGTKKLKYVVRRCNSSSIYTSSRKCDWEDVGPYDFTSIGLPGKSEAYTYCCADKDKCNGGTLPQAGLLFALLLMLGVLALKV